MESKNMLKIASAISSLIAVILVIVLPVVRDYSFSNLSGGSESAMIRTFIIISILASIVACIFTFVKSNKSNLLQIVFNVISACPILVLIFISISNGKIKNMSSGLYLNVLFTIIAIVLVVASRKTNE